MKNVDLFVIGGGSGGVRAARIAATHGASVALAEEYRMGGTCVIRGCVPKKLMVMASRFADEFEAAAGFGWTAGSAHFDWVKLMARINAELNRLEDIYATNLRKVDVQIYAERATILDAHTVLLQSSGEKIRANYILIATGATPIMPQDVPGAQFASSSNEFFLWPTQPKRVVVQGAGYIALELACLLKRLGSAVTLVMRGDHVLRGFDQQLRELIQTQLTADGMVIKTNTTLQSIEQSIDEGLSSEVLQVKLSDGTVLSADRVLRATGRRPNTASLGLETVAIKLDKIGAISVDDFAATAVPSIYAVGDVTNRVTLTPAAIREGHAFADSVFGKKPRPVRIDVIPTAVFTTPELATVGLTEEAARKTYPNIDIYSTRFRSMKVAMAEMQTYSFMKIIVDRDSDRVLGVHLIGPDSGEMIQLVGIAIQMKATKADFDATLAVHPTIAEELVTMRIPNA
jgi:glutathione reductase (NADPH)